MFYLLQYCRQLRIVGFRRWIGFTIWYIRVIRNVGSNH
jgi:hypothetical protein